MEVETAGKSAGGAPIHHVRSGKGPVRALLVGFADCMEPIGALTVAGLMKLITQGAPEIIDVGVEWHVVPCADPDGALLNEGWTQAPVTPERFMRHYYVPASRDRLEETFPLRHKKLFFNEPSQEAQVLSTILDGVRPDFYFPLHNAWVGGAFHYLTRDIGESYYRETRDLLDSIGFPLQKRPLWKEFLQAYEVGFVEMYSKKKLYDYLEQVHDRPEDLLSGGAMSIDYLSEIKPEALSFLVELGYLRHPADESERVLNENMRRFMLRTEADSKFLGTLMLEEWERTRDDLDTESPFYRAVTGGGLFPTRDRLLGGGMPISRYPTSDFLFNPEWDRPMTEADQFTCAIVDGGFLFLFKSYQFVRLLKASPQTERVRRAVEKLDKAYDETLAKIGESVDISAFEAFDYDTMVRAQLGGGLIALNAVINELGT